MNNFSIILLALTIFIFALFSKKLHNSIVTLPMAFTLVGYLLGPDVLHWIDFSLSSKFIRILAELTLILVLYSDASRIHLACVKKFHNLPIRLLLIGLPLTLILGAAIGKWCFPEFIFWEAAILGAILTPTDAALIHSVISYPKVPLRIRQALNIESGLNDGIMVPIFFGFLSFISVAEKKMEFPTWIFYFCTQIFLGILLGVVMGYLGAKICAHGKKKQWMGKIFGKLSAIALVFLAYALAEALTGNGFIASFACGLTVGNTSKPISTHIQDFSTAEGQLLVLILFFFFGSSFAGHVIKNINWMIFFYALLSLTIIRILPVLISTVGCALKWETQFYLGWFGPRGVASIVFAFLLIEKIDTPASQLIFSTAVTAIFLSIFLHGITSMPLAKWYSKKIKKDERKIFHEHKSVVALPIRYHKSYE